MIIKINKPVSVILGYNHKLRLVSPKKILWQEKEYSITKVGLHHSFYKGRILYHIFSVISGSIFFRLSLNTSNLFWTMEEISTA